MNIAVPPRSWEYTETEEVQLSVGRLSRHVTKRFSSSFW